MAIWIVYRKGSFWLKERLDDRAALTGRIARLEREGALYISIENAAGGRFARALELPAVER